MLDTHGKGLSALKKRAEPATQFTSDREEKGSFLDMAKPGVKIGFFYSSLGALAACIALPILSVVSFNAVFPATVCLSLAAIGFGTMSRKGLVPGLKRKRDLSQLLNLELPPNFIFKTKIEGQGDIALLGHEIKNYLCTLKGNSKLLRMRGASQDNNVILDRIDRVVEKLEIFAQDLGHSSLSPKVTNQRLSTTPPIYSNGLTKARGLTLRPVNLGEVARACVKTHFHAQAKEFRWDTQFEKENFLGDPDRLEQVFLNLYRNATEAEALNIETKVRCEGKRLVVTIEDDGKGCLAEDIGGIFTPFFTSKPGPVHRGLGLFIVQSIVEIHGGKIRADSKNNPATGSHGLVFTLDLPLSEPLPLSLETENHISFNYREVV
jgi:signal transduction histidine kinase